jgi:hypothetical protein
MKRIKNISQLKLLEILNRIPIFKSLQPTDRSELASMPNLVVFIEKDTRALPIKLSGLTQIWLCMIWGEIWPMALTNMTPMAKSGARRLYGA